MNDSSRKSPNQSPTFESVPRSPYDLNIICYRAPLHGMKKLKAELSLKGYRDHELLIC